MEDKPNPAKLAGMFIGGYVPFETAGPVFKAFYAAGADPKSFELAPIYQDPAHVTAAIEGLRGQIGSSGAVPQLTDQSSPRPERKKRKSGPQTSGMKAYLLRLIGTSPRSRDEMRRLMESQDQWKAKSLDARLHDIAAKKFSYRDADGLYHLTERGRDAIAPKSDEAIAANGAEPKPQRSFKKRLKGAKTQVDIILNFLEKAHPEAVPLRKMTAMFKTKGFRKESASVALHVLKAKGLIEMTAPAIYKFVSKPPQEK